MDVAQLAERSLPNSDTRGPWLFESSDRQDFMMNMFTIFCWKDEIKKEAWDGPLKQRVYEE